jgi:hypothetical protein
MVMTVPPCNFTGCPVRGSSGHERDIPEVWRLEEAAAADDPVRLVSVHALEAVRTMAQKPLRAMTVPSTTPIKRLDMSTSP